MSDPLAQTFTIEKRNFPNGVFINALKLFFNNKPMVDRSPITIGIFNTLNSYPSGLSVDHSIVSMDPIYVNISDNPQYSDPTTYTKFSFPVPVFLQSGIPYAILIKSNSNEYSLWTAYNGDEAVASSSKNAATDPDPTVIAKISTSPFIGSLFVSQNSQLWTPDLNQSLMFVIDRCVFDISKNPSIQFVVPNKLPQRSLVDNAIDYFTDAANTPNVYNSVTSSNVAMDAINVTTTDFVPTGASINYSYAATLNTGLPTSTTSITPGKFGSTMYENIYFSDGLGERVLAANSNSSFSIYTSLASNDDAVSPLVSDAGLSVYAIQFNINNCELSNSLIQLTSGGTGYNASLTSVTISPPTATGGTQAYAAANISAGVIQNIYLTSNGSGYIETPTITIADANTTPGTGASANIYGETSKTSGPGLAKYYTKKVVLNAGFDSGDLIVYVDAYRPVNTDIVVYYKILNRSDTQLFDDGKWQKMTMINSGSSVYSQVRNEVIEYSFAPGTGGNSNGYVSYTSTNGQVYTSFSQYAIKIVLTSADKTYVPYLKNVRTIALPANVNNTV